MEQCKHYAYNTEVRNTKESEGVEKGAETNISVLPVLHELVLYISLGFNISLGPRADAYRKPIDRKHSAHLGHFSRGEINCK